jgi:hypothetical protein
MKDELQNALEDIERAVKEKLVLSNQDYFMDTFIIKVEEKTYWTRWTYHTSHLPKGEWEIDRIN